MEDTPDYIILRVWHEGNPTGPEDPGIQVFSKALKRSPVAVFNALEAGGSITLRQVPNTSDVGRIKLALERRGMKVQILTEDPAEDPPNQTADPEAYSPSDSAEDQWKEGDVIEGLYDVRGHAAGGMGLVYFVHHRLWNMMLAIKTPLKQAVKNESSLKRFLREAELWVHLGLHPNIATCYYARVIQGLPRLFIEYVDGGSLDDWLDRGGGKDLGEMVDLMIQFCHGMIHAESRGMMHRDIKPPNCLITKDGMLKITDFGLVKLVDDPASAGKGAGSVPMDAGDDDGRITRYDKEVLGSPWYMAPERFNPQMHEDIRADIYSFGIMLYEVVLGTMPFRFPKGFSLKRLVQRQLKGKPTDPLLIRPDLPRPLVDVMMTCLQKDPNARYPSFVETAHALETAYGKIKQGMTPRKKPSLVGLKADSLNNQAVSLLDLGRKNEARKLLDGAYSADTNHLQAVYNLSTRAWLNGEASDHDAVTRMKSLKIEVRQSADYEHLMGLICLQRGEVGRAVRLLENASRRLSHYRERWKPHGGNPAKFVESLGLHPIEERSTFAGHVKRVLTLSFSPDKRRAYSVGEDRSIRVWDMKTKRCLKNIRTFNFVPVAGAFSRDGALAATGYGTAFKTLDLWNTKRGMVLRKYQGMEVLGIAFSPDSRLLAASGEKGRLRICETSSQNIVWEAPAPAPQITAMAFLGDGRSLVLAREDGSLALWSLNSHTPTYQIAAHEGAVTCIALSPDFTMMATGGTDETVRLWESVSGSEITQLRGHRAKLVGVHFIPGTNSLVSGSSDGFAKIWDLNKKSCCRTISLTGQDLSAFAISRKGGSLLFGGGLGSVRLWSLDTGWFGHDFLEPALARPKTFGELKKLHASFRAAVDEFRAAWNDSYFRKALDSLEKVRSIAGFSWSRESILIRSLVQEASRSKAFRSSTFIRSLDGHDGAVTCIASSDDGLMIATGSTDGTVVLWDVVTGHSVRRLKPMTPVRWISFLPKGQGIISCSDDKVLRQWDISGNMIRETVDVVPPIRLSANGEALMAMSPRHYPLRIPLASGRKEKAGEAFVDEAFICFSRDLSILYELREGVRIRKRSRTTGQELGAFRDLGTIVTSVVPAITDDKVIAGLESGEIMVYMVGSGMNVAALRGHTAAVRALDCTPDGALWVSGSDDHSLRLWDLAQQKCLAVLEGHSAPVRTVNFFPNSCMLAGGSLDGSLRLWGLEWDFSADGLGAGSGRNS
ncbi:protein kinase [Thermodesulfobacteriota bacterium]